MKTFKSKSGNRIAYEKSGKGPPLVLVHGTNDAHNYWELILPELEAYYTVYALDRRGRGESGDHPTYRLDLEVEDVAEFIESVNEPVILLGHSYGGTISLEASLNTENISKLILYEPPGFHKSDESDDALPKAIAKMEEDLREGKREEALLFFQENLAGLSSKEIKEAQSTPYWEVMLDAVHTVPRELKAVEDYRFDETRFRNLSLPTLLLSGTESPGMLRKSVEVLDGVLSQSEIKIFEGQGHDAAKTAPELFLKKVLEFLRDS